MTDLKLIFYKQQKHISIYQCLRCIGFITILVSNFFFLIADDIVVNMNDENESTNAENTSFFFACQPCESQKLFWELD